MDDHNPSSPPENNREAQSEPIEAIAGSPALPTVLQPEQSPGPWQQLRRFFACNPFYLVSAALLLYSFYLISGDRSFLPSEVGQLSFNLSSLQLYEIALVVTAIFLARRAVWYDSTLLVGLENLLLLVPFILISQAALIDARLVWVLCIAAGVLAGSRLSLLRRFISELNFPRPLVATGTFVLLVNALLPIVYRVFHESKFGTKPDWGAAYETNQYVWWMLMPVLCALILFVPWTEAPSREPWPQRGWLPLGLFSLWLAGTGVHLYCLGYVYDFGLRPELLAPAVWTLIWVFYLRIDNLLPTLKKEWKYAMWVLAAISTLLATPQPQKAVFLVLTVLNAVIFGVIYRQQKIPVALHLALLSLAAMLAGLPEQWARALSPKFDRETCLAGAAVIYLVVCAARSRDPKLGVLGALVAAVAVGNSLPEPAAIHWSVQTGLVFLLVHSLRWSDSEEQGAGVLRWLVASAWVAHSVAWTHLYSAGWKVCLFAVPVLVTWFAFRWWHTKWGPVAIVAGALLVLLAAPGHVAAVQLQSTPMGLLAVIGSFALFGLGTIAAITKHRWSSS